MKNETFTVYITEPCMISGEHKEVGEAVELDPNDAHAVVGAGRGTLDKAKGERAKAAVAKAKKATE